jgi:AraC family transcriptional regulator
LVSCAGLAALPPQGRSQRRAHLLELRLLTRVDEYIRAQLGEDNSVATLAALCGMRPDTFARQFSAAMTKAPYAHVMACRIDRAQQLLRTTATDVASR